MKVLGLMSGTSLDGVDLVLTEFNETEDHVSYKILAAKTFKYPVSLQEKLSDSFLLNGLELSVLDIRLSSFYAEIIQDFLQTENQQCDLIASHGHTVFHQPGIGLTKQIGDGATLFSKIQIPVICNFRAEDVALGGQGAPLVPVGDELLFAEYGACLNLGGIANISFSSEGKRIAYDICPVNMGFNYYAHKFGKAYDENGEIARSGKIDYELLEKLNHIEFYNKPYPKSLGKEWFDKEFLPLCFSLKTSDEAILATLNQHAALKISEAILETKAKTTLATGGGVYNAFLMENITEMLGDKAEVVIPSQELVEFKEGLIFGLLGFLKAKNKINILKSVTGCKNDHSAGCLYGFISC